MNTKISFSGEVLEEVESFVYLGSIFTCDGNCTEDIRKRLAMGRSTMQSLSSVWKSKDISTTTKVTLLKALVGSNLWEWILCKLNIYKFIHHEGSPVHARIQIQIQKDR